MSDGRWERLEELFHAALELPAAERPAFLAAAAAGDDGLRDEVAAMLAGHERSPAAGLESWLESWLPSDPGPALAEGASVGPYRLLERLGEGGMAQVFLAERADGQFRQTVALKLLRAGHDADWVVRFRTEREILARLEHPHIARLLDGGVTEQGLPYLVMERVRGQPITAACDERRATVAERIRVFQRVCRAVQFAHQNLVVHRDLKPPNILVDELGEVKLLDFGIAKILAGEGAVPDATRTALRLMTPAFASPEQILGGAMTTATDVYALGLLLYELLTGCRAQDVDGLPPGALERRVCEVDPPPPSVAVLAGGAASARRAELRGGVSPERLARLLRDDLDTIVAAAAHKDPARRYSSAGQLADDLERHLAGQPVLARPDTLRYRAAKFARRHRVALAAATLAVAALLGGLGVATVGLVRARRAEAVARAEAETARQASDLMVELFRVNEPGEARGNEVTARELLDRGAERLEVELADQPAVRARLLGAIRRAYGELGLFDAQLRASEREVAAQVAAHGPQHPEVAAALTNLADAHADKGAYEQARDVARRAVVMYERSGDEESVPLAAALSQLAITHWHLGELKEARALLERSLAMRERLLGPDAVELGGILNNVAILRWQEGDAAGARPLYERALALFLREHGEDHPSVAHTLNNLALVHEQTGDLAAARAAHERALAIRRRILAPDHVDIGESLNNLGNALRLSGELEAAREAFTAALAIRERARGPEHTDVASTLHNLGVTLTALGEPAAARPLLERSLAIFTAALGPDHVYNAFPLAGLAELDHRAGSLPLAEQRFRRALALGEAGLGPAHPDLAEVRRGYAALLRDLGRAGEAEAMARAPRTKAPAGR